MTAERYVLVVDDEQRLTAFLKDFLTKAGYQMHVASSGQEALDAVKAHIPALVLLDMRMPGIDGVQVLQTLKQKYPSIKVVVMTSYDEEYKQAAEKYGADAFFPKPLSLSELTSKIEELLQHPASNPSPHVSVQAEGVPTDLIPKAKLLFVTVNPFASFLMKGAIHCVGDQPLEKGSPAYPDAGEYELDEAATQKEVFEKLKILKPDFVLVAIDWKQDDIGIFRSRRIAASDLVTEIMHSPLAPREVFLFGGFGGHEDKLQAEALAGRTSLEEPTWGDFERQAAKVNRILWQKCMKLGLVTKHPQQSGSRGKE